MAYLLRTHRSQGVVSHSMTETKFKINYMCFTCIYSALVLLGFILELVL